MEKIDYTEEKIDQLKSEYKTQTDILKKYWKVLIKKGLSIAKERGLETLVIDENERGKRLDFVPDIIIYCNGDNVDAEQTISLIKNIHPGIYNCYLQRQLKHKELEKELIKIIEYLNQHTEEEI
jgi:hypothetical protein